RNTRTASTAASPIRSDRGTGNRERLGTPSPRALARTRSRRAGFAEGVVRSPVTNASSSGGRSSAIISLPEQLAQLLESALHSHLQCRLSYTGDRGDVRVAQVLHVAQQEHLPLVRREPAQQPCGLLASDEARVAGRAVLVRGRLFDCPSTLALRQDGPAAIDQDAVEPSGKPFTVLVRSERPVGADKGVLQGLFGIFAAAEHARGEARKAPVVAVDDDPIGVHVTREHAGNHLP